MSYDLKIGPKGDLVIENGLIQTVTDNDKLVQDIIKILLTDLGENKFHPNYGSKVGALEIGSVPDQDLLKQDLTASAETAIRKLMQLQRTQAQKQFLTPGETIIDILDVSVDRDQIDPRLYNIFISVVTPRKVTHIDSITVRVI